MPSKLCPHIQILDTVTLDAIRRVQPPMVKTMDLGRSTLQSIRTAAPGSLIVARKDTEDKNYTADPVATGRAYAASYGDVLDLVDVVEVFNESVNNTTTPADRAAFDTYQAAFAARIWELRPQVKIGLFCLPTGNFAYPGEPKLTDFPKSLALPQDRVYICLHEYAWYTWDWESPARCLRYRKQMEGLSSYRVLITECGLTHAVVTGQPDVGWRTGVTRELFISGATWYDRELQQDPYVLGAALFICGPSYGWDTFECTAEWEEMTHAAPAPQPSYRTEWLDYKAPARWLAGQQHMAGLKVRNTGTAAWDAQTVKLGYHWLTPQGQPIAAADLRTTLPVKVAAGMILSLTKVQVAAPAVGGDYTLRWDFVQNDGTWFASQGASPFNVTAKVESSATPPDELHFPETNCTVKGVFLTAFRRYGQDACGYPVTNALTEQGLASQYFQRVALEEYAPGQVRFKPIGAELFAAQAKVAELERQVQALTDEAASLSARIAELAPDP